MRRVGAQPGRGVCVMSKKISVEIESTCMFCGKMLVRAEDVGAVDLGGVMYGKRKEYGFKVCKKKECIEKLKKLFKNSEKNKTLVRMKEEADAEQKIIDLLDESVEN